MIALLFAVVTAQISDAPTAPRPLNWSPAIDISATVAMTTLWLVTETAAKSALAPPGCRWCETNSFDLGVRRALVAPGLAHRTAADTASNLTVASSALVLLGLDAVLVGNSEGDAKDWATDAVLLAEAAAAAMTLDQGVKFLAARDRPLLYDLSPAQRAVRTDNDGNLSFFSGHSTITAALAGAAGSIAWLRGYRHGWLAWVIGGAFAVATGLLRISADKHWFTDVITGLAVGSSIGVGVPLLFHHRATPLSVALGLNGAVVTVRF